MIVCFLGSVTFFAFPIGGCLSGILAEAFGRKVAMMLLMPVFVLHWFIYFYATNVMMLIISSIISGLAGGLVEAATIMYAAEVSEPRLRGALTATGTVSIIFGMLAQTLIGRFYDWRTVAGVSIIFPVMCFLGLIFVPESPYWLASEFIEPIFLIFLLNFCMDLNPCMAF